MFRNLSKHNGRHSRTPSAGTQNGFQMMPLTSNHKQIVGIGDLSDGPISLGDATDVGVNIAGVEAAQVLTIFQAIRKAHSN